MLKQLNYDMKVKLLNTIIVQENFVVQNSRQFHMCSVVTVNLTVCYRKLSRAASEYLVVSRINYSHNEANRAVTILHYPFVAGASPWNY